MVAATVAIGFISLSVWAHHMFTIGMTSYANAFFVASTAAIAVPTGIKIFNWLGTMWGGKIRYSVAMMFCVAFLCQFLIAGLTGIMLSAAPFDWQLGNSYFVIAHFHYVILGGIVFAVFAGVYYWFPKVTGKMLSETLGKWHFWLFLIGFHLTFDFMHIPGHSGYAAPHLHLRRQPRLGDLELDCLDRRDLPGAGILFWVVNVVSVVLQGQERWQRSLGCLDAGVGNHFAAAGLQLRGDSGGAQPASAVGFEASGRSGLEVRIASRSAQKAQKGALGSREGEQVWQRRR